MENSSSPHRVTHEGLELGLSIRMGQLIIKFVPRKTKMEERLWGAGTGRLSRNLSALHKQGIFKLPDHVGARNIGVPEIERETL